MNRDNDKGKVLLQRTMLVAAVFFVLLMALIGRLYYLQVYQGEKYKMLADENRISTRVLVPPRGSVYDRNGAVLATNEQNFQALIIAEQTPDLDKTLNGFKKIIPLSEEEEAKIRNKIYYSRKFVPIKLKDNLTWNEVSALQLNAPELSGIFISEGLNRTNPLGKYTARES